MSDLHGQIMKLPSPAYIEHADTEMRISYKTGHRDARHAAAEIALKGDACADALRSLLARYTSLVTCGDCGSWDPELEADVIAARAALAAVGAA